MSLEASGLVGALQELANGLELRTGVRCRLVVDQPAPELPIEVATHLYRIAQEAATNALKHAGTDDLVLALLRSGDAVTLQITDHGGGLPPDAEAGLGLGLHAMRYRAGFVGATLSAPSCLNTRSAMKHRIFVVEDHALTRRGYAALLGEEPDLGVTGEAASADDALAAFERGLPDLVLLDLTLGGMSGLELLKHLRARYPDLPVLVVSMHDESLYGERVLRAGARGYVMKSEVDSVIVQAIRRIMAGGMFVSEQMGAKILVQYAGAPKEPAASPVDALSDRELEVFEHLGRGLATPAIAEAMLISPKTVDIYRARILRRSSASRPTPSCSSAPPAGRRTPTRCSPPFSTAGLVWNAAPVSCYKGEARFRSRARPRPRHPRRPRPERRRPRGADRPPDRG